MKQGRTPRSPIRPRKKRLLLLLALVLPALALAGCGAKEEGVPITRLEQLGEPGRKILLDGEDITAPKYDLPKARQSRMGFDLKYPLFQI